MRRWGLLWTQQIGVCTGILPGAPAYLTSGSQSLANKQASRCSSVRSRAYPLPRKYVGGDWLSSDGRRQQQEHLWQQFFLEPTRWWDNRQDKTSSRSPDFRRKGSGERLWVNDLFKPAWVDEQLVSLDMEVGHGDSPSESRSLDKPGPGRRAGWGMGVVTDVTVSTLCQQGRLSEAVGALESLAQTDSAISLSLFCNVLKLCAAKKDVVGGRRVHHLSVKLGSESNAYLGNHIMRMYACGGRLEEAMDVFTRVGNPDVITWSSIISAHAKHGKPKEGIKLYHEMRRSGVKADAHVFVAALQACIFAADLESGRQVHCDVLDSGIPLHSNAFLGNHLLRMYACGGRLEEAMDVFARVGKPDVITWGSIISAHAKHGKPEEAIQLYHEMRRSGVKGDAHVFVAALQACAFAADLESGRKVHCDVLHNGFPVNLFVGTCLVDMYAKCGELKDALQVFDNMATKNVVTWTALIAGYAEQGLGHEALVRYEQMEQEGLSLANHFTFACLLNACGSTGALQKGRYLHSKILKRGLLGDLLVGTCLVDMYAKCGELEHARQVFDSMATKDVVTWTALISGYGTCGDGNSALACFKEMLDAGIQPDGATFTCLLVACSHEGLVHEGRNHFDSMATQHGIKPTIEHYTCMVDLLGRAGHLDEAKEMLLLCEGQSNVVGLRSLLNACKSHGDIERAMWCFESIVRLVPQEAPAYVLMANAYADAGRWTEVDRIETQRRVAGANKKPAVATIEVNKEVHRFVVGERREDIALKVESTKAHVKQEGGHEPHTKLVLKPVCEDDKEDVLCGHAEKLALAFGILNTPSGTPLLVTKNLRMCSDCHSSTEILSRLEQRDIVVRDGYRVHRFAGGCCSCKGRP